jgi:hypothetical protein
MFAGALLAACASGGASSRTEESRLSGTLLVDNRGWKPVTVYISRRGELRRLGNVDAVSGRSFGLDQLAFAVDGRDEYLVARPLAGEPMRSEPFTFAPGRTTVWTIESVAAKSRLETR